MGNAALFPPLDFGVDISIHATTKYPSGHFRLVMGAVSANKKTWPQLLETQLALGICGAPEVSYLILRGLARWALRLEHHQNSALAIARWLEEREEVVRVLHPGLESFPAQP